MAATARIVDKDRGAKALLDRLAKGVASTTVGIHEDDGAATYDDSGATVAEVFTYHEFGMGVPQRSWLRDFFDENRDGLAIALRKIGQAVVTGKIQNVAKGIDRFGLLMVGEIQQRIRAGIEPELAESTIEAKGSDTPLIDSGKGWGSIRHHVSDKK